LSKPHCTDIQSTPTTTSDALIKNHLRQTFATIGQGVREPKSIGPTLRTSLIGLFQSRGGGLYALGYVVTFVVLEVLEIPEMFADLAGLFAAGGSLFGGVIALVVDFFVDLITNMVYGFIWPALLIEWLGWWGVLLLAIGFATFNRFLRPIMERFVPELKPDTSSEDSPDSLAENAPESPPESLP